MKVSALLPLSFAAVAVAGGCRPVQPSCTIEKGIDRPGGDYKSEQVSSFEECVKQCKADSNCAAVNFHKDTQFCYFKDSANSRREDSNVDGAVCRKRTQKTTTTTKKVTTPVITTPVITTPVVTTPVITTPVITTPTTTAVITTTTAAAPSCTEGPNGPDQFGCTFRFYCGVKIVDPNTLETHTGYTAQQCRDECSNFLRCNWFSWDPSGVCNLYADPADPSSFPGGVVGYRSSCS